MASDVDALCACCLADIVLIGKKKVDGRDDLPPLICFESRRHTNCHVTSTDPDSRTLIRTPDG